MRLTALICTVFILSSASQAQADKDRNAFYPDKFTDDYYGDKIYDASSSGRFNILHQPPVKPVKNIDEEQMEALTKEATKALSKKLPKEQKDAFTEVGEEDEELDEATRRRREIVSEYGDPRERQELRVQEDAPPPFQGMIKAIDAGDEELAYQYALQYTRYTNDFKGMLETVVGTQSLAQEELGLVGEAKADPTFDKFRYLMNNKDFDPMAPVETDKAIIEQEVVNDEARRFFDRIIEEEKKRKSGISDLEDALPSLPTDRKGIKKLLKTKKIAYDPEGVDVYFFYRPEDKRAIQMMPVAEELHQSSQRDRKINFIGLTYDYVPAGTLVFSQKSTNTTFRVEDGSRMARELELKVVPTTVVVGRSTGQIIREEGIRGFEYLDELVKMVLGRE